MGVGGEMQFSHVRKPAQSGSFKTIPSAAVHGLWRKGTTEVHGVNLITGRRTLLYRLTPSDRAGVTDAPSVQIAPDGRSYTYSYFRILSDLYSISSLN